MTRFTIGKTPEQEIESICGAGLRQVADGVADRLGYSPEIFADGRCGPGLNRDPLKVKARDHVAYALWKRGMSIVKVAVAVRMRSHASVSVAIRRHRKEMEDDACCARLVE